MTRREFLLPDLGEGIGSAEITAWLVETGASVAEHQPVVEVETDKARVELPAPISGVISFDSAVGDMVKVGEPIAVFEVPATTDLAPSPPTPESADEAESPDPATAGTSDDTGDNEVQGRRVLAAPTVRILARERGIDLNAVQGSGPGGRVLREDLEQAERAEVPTGTSGATGTSEATDDAGAADASDAAGSADAQRESRAEPPAATQMPRSDEAERIPLRGLRRTIAKRMTEIAQTVPMISGMQEVDVTELGTVLADLTARAERQNVRMTWTALFAMATVQALQENPALNSAIDLEREEIVQHRSVHLGVATASDDGLLVPVIRDADRLSLLDLAAEINRVGERARSRKASPAELTGSTFTLSNYGAVGGWFGTMIVNAPEVGIIGFGRVEPRPLVVEGELQVRTVVPLSTTADHRVVDGVVGARFGAAVRRLLEHPHELMLGARRW